MSNRPPLFAPQAFLLPGLRGRLIEPLHYPVYLSRSHRQAIAGVAARMARASIHRPDPGCPIEVIGGSSIRRGYFLRQVALAAEAATRPISRVQDKRLEYDEHRLVVVADTALFDPQGQLLDGARERLATAWADCHAFDAQLLVSAPAPGLLTRLGFSPYRCVRVGLGGKTPHITRHTAFDPVDPVPKAA